jgi:type IV pilus assembly protein PilQ
MIRFLLAALLLHFSVSMISCTSKDVEDNPNATEEGNGSAGPIDESEITDTAATTKAGGEDDLENELAGEKPAEGAPEASASAETVPPNEATPPAEVVPPAEDELSKDLSEQDLEPSAPVAKNDAPIKEDELAPPTDEPSLEVEPPVPGAEAPPPQVEKAKVRDIRYMSNANGGTVVIETSKPVTYQSRMNPATQQFVIEIADVELPAALQRPYNMKEFGSRFGSVNAYQSAGSTTARVVIQMSGPAATEPIVQQEGTSLVVIPPAAPAVAANTPEPSASAVQKPAQGQSALSARTLDEFLTGNQRFYGRAISLQVKDADIRDVINFLAEESGANIVMSDDVAGKISLKLRKIPWDQALVTVMRSKGLGYTRQGNVLRISSMKSLQNETEVANKLIESQKAIAPMVVQVIPVSYAAMEEILRAVTPFLTKEIGKAVIDTRSSTLIVTDRGEAVDRVVKLVKTLDIAPQQVSIESKIVEAVEGFSNFVGVNWGASGSPVHLSNSGGANGAPVDLGLGIQSTTLSQDFASGNPFSANLNIGTLDILGTLTATLTLAEQDSLAKVITAPRISTMNREKSTIIQQGENVSVIATKSETTGAVAKTEKRTPFKMQLEVTPQITADGGVIMELDVQREFLGPVIDQEIQSRAVNTRKAHTKVLVRNGQTAVIGGIFNSDETEQRNGVPGLKDLPIIGWFFRNKSFTRDKNELLIFVTPRILASDNAGTEQAAN